MKLRRRFRYTLRKSIKNRKLKNYDYEKKRIFDYSFKVGPAFYHDLTKRNSIKRLTAQITSVRYSKDFIIYYLGESYYTGFSNDKEGVI